MKLELAWYNTLMLLFKDALDKLPIVSLQTGRVCGEIYSVILNPKTFAIEAFDARVGRRKRVLFAHDIKEMTAKLCVIDDETQLMEDEDLVRLDHLRYLEYSLTGKRVRTKSGMRLGKVKDWVFDSQDFEIAKLHVKQAVRKDINVSTIIIDRSSVVELKKRHIVVDDAFAKNNARSRTGSRNNLRPNLRQATQTNKSES